MIMRTGLLGQLWAQVLLAMSARKRPVKIRRLMVMNTLLMN